MTRSVALLLLVMAVAIPACSAESDPASALPGPTLDGPNVVSYPLGSYNFEADARKVLRQGFKDGDGCGMSTSETLTVGQEVQEIVVAMDTESCEYLLVRGTPARG